MAAGNNSSIKGSFAIRLVYTQFDFQGDTTMKAKGQKHPVGTAGVGFRAPIEEDIEAIQAGWKRAVPQEYPLGTFERSFRDHILLSEEEGLSRVATIGDEIIGFTCVIGGALRAIYVEDPYRRQGIGDTLLSAMIEFAREKRWDRLAVVTSHGWVGTMPGIDICYETTIRFLEHRGFEKGGLRADVGTRFHEIDAASGQCPLKCACSVSEYHPDDLDDMRAYDERRASPWCWVDWIEKFPQADSDRARLVARIEGRLVGCVDAKISVDGVAGLAHISVDKDYRHRGIGSALLREVASLCKQRGATSMFAPMARREFYEANGWYAQREFVAMTKPLTA